MSNDDAKKIINNLIAAWDKLKAETPKDSHAPISMNFEWNGRLFALWEIDKRFTQFQPDLSKL